MKYSKLSLALLALPVSAFAFVFVDPTNLVQNTVTAAKSLATQANTAIVAKKAIADEITQTKALINLVKSTANTIRDIKISDPKNALERLADLTKSAKALDQAVGNSQTLYSNVQAMYGAGNYKSWDDFAKSLAERKKAGDTSAKNLMKSAEIAQKQIIEADKAHKNIALTMPQVQGVTEATQATTAAIAVVIDNNAAMLNLMAAANADAAIIKTQNIVKDNADEKKAKDYVDARKDDMTELKKKYPD